MPEKTILLTKISNEMKVLTRLLAYNITQGQKNVADKAMILSRLGLSLTEMAVICGTSPKAVSVRLAEARRNKKRGTGDTTDK